MASETQIILADTGDTSAPAPKRGIATIANDKVYHWVVPFLEDWRQTNAGTPLQGIPNGASLNLRCLCAVNRDALSGFAIGLTLEVLFL